MTGKPFAPATDRNRHAILDVLRLELADCVAVLEIGSGTGQHAVHFAREMPGLVWQTSDRVENHAAIRAWLSAAALPNVRSPLDLDVRMASVEAAAHDAVFSANTAHIMSFAAVKNMFELVARTLREGGVFVLYGPFRIGGGFNTDSNAAFHTSLRATDPDMGIRHLEDLDKLAQHGGMRRLRLYAMPANNYLAVWCRQCTGAAS